MTRIYYHIFVALNMSTNNIEILKTRFRRDLANEDALIHAIQANGVLKLLDTA